MEFMTVNELAKMLRVSTKTVRRLVEAGEISFYRVGKAIRFDSDAVTNFLKNKECVCR